MISLVVPLYNSGATFKRWHNSVVQQEVSPDEIVYVDGGSIDNTHLLVKKVLRSADKLIIARDEGPYDAMNKGILESRGDVVCILNSDDEWMPDAIGFVSGVFAANKTIDIVHGNVLYLFADGREHILSPLSGPLGWLGLGLPSVHPATFIRRRVYDEIGLYDFRNFPVCADQDFIYRCISQRRSFLYLNRILAKMHSGGLSSSGQFSSEIDRLLWSFKGIQGVVSRAVRKFVKNDMYYLSSPGGATSKKTRTSLA